MDLTPHFAILARYNRIANERLFAACAQLDEAAYRLSRAGSFGSIHALLNHILLGDRVWMGRFEGGQRTTPPLQQILYHDFSELRDARSREDARIESFFANLNPAFWESTLAYTNSLGKSYIDTTHTACSHLFNHQTHHRGQVCVMLSQTPVKPPSLDMHRILHP